MEELFQQLEEYLSCLDADSEMEARNILRSLKLAMNRSPQYDLLTTIKSELRDYENASGEIYKLKKTVKYANITEDGVTIFSRGFFVDSPNTPYEIQLLSDVVRSLNQ